MYTIDFIGLNAVIHEDISGESGTGANANTIGNANRTFTSGGYDFYSADLSYRLYPNLSTHATGSLDYAPGGSLITISAGNTLIIDDGVNDPVTFTFSSSPSSDTQIAFNNSVVTNKANNIVSKVNAVSAPLNIVAEVDASDGNGNTVLLRNTIPTIRSNVALAGTVITSANMGALGMAGGGGILSDTLSGSLLHALNLHRNGPYSFATFKQIRIHENPITRYQRKNNILSFTKRGEQIETTDSNNSVLLIQEKFGENVAFQEPVLVSTYHPLQYNLGSLRGDSDGSFDRFGLSFDYGNHITYFTNEELNKLLLLEDLEDEVYEQIKDLYLNGALRTNASEIDYFEFLRYKQEIYPREINRYSAEIRQRTNYLNDFWRDVRDDRSSSRVSGFGYSSFASMWNMDAEIDWATRSSVEIGVSPNTTGEGILQNNYCHFTDDAAGVSKIDDLRPAPVYNRRHTIPNPFTASVVSPSGIEIPDTASLHLSSPDLGIAFQGDALWEAGNQAGKNPFYSSYDYFAEELRGLGKDYSIVPEFRISDHVEKLLRKGNLRKLSTMLEITGGKADTNNSNDSGFYETYSTSDFLKHFASIKEDHKDFEDPATITLTCKALKKFLAYDSFYPQDRSVDCAEQFYDSYEKYVNFGTPKDIGIQPLLDPLFAPGVLYNTIKSGIAVDYPLVMEDEFLTYNFNHGSGPKFHGIAQAAFDKRIPFEALLEPEKYLAEANIISNTAHPSGALPNATSSWDGQGDNLYTKMMSNYLAEIPEFFLKGGQFTTIASEQQGSDNFGVAEFGKSYAMRLKIYKTLQSGKQGKTRVNLQTAEGQADFFIGGYTAPQSVKIGETITMYSRPSAFGPPCAGYSASHEDVFYDARNGFNPPYTPPYYDGEAWIDFVWKAPDGGTAALTAGQQTGKFSLAEILSNVTSSALRIDSNILSHDLFAITGATTLGPLGLKEKAITSDERQVLFSSQFDQNYFGNAFSRVNFNAMQLFASVNPMQAGKIISRDIDNDTILNENIQQVIDVNKGATDARWIIQTKFETPILNFKDVALTTSSVNLHNAQTPRGMWHQYGVIPENTDGIYLQLQDLPDNWLKYKNNNTTINPQWHTTGSLADLCGFPTNPVKLGQITQGRVISEAVVAVPYINDGGIKKFFEINQDNYNSAKKYFQAIDIVNKGGNPANLGLGNPDFWEERAGSSVIQQVTKMRKYVFPPTMDFFNYSEVTPFSMYIFEFNHTLSQDDLSDIWQGLPPKIGTSFEIAEDSISHPLLANQLLGSGEGTDKFRIGAELNEEIRWMVFKVKKRAKTNYFDKIVGKKSGYGQAAAAAGFTTNAESESSQEEFISYNWPYDFFSLVELVKIDAEIEFSEISQEDESGPKFTPKRREIPEAVQQFQASLSSRRR